MKRSYRLIATLAGTLCMTLAASAAPPGGASSVRAVTSTVLDRDEGDRTYEISSDSTNPETNGAQYANGTDGVVSRLQDTGEWELSTLASATRRLIVDLPGAPSTAWPGRVTGRFVTQCFMVNGNTQGYPAVGNMTYDEQPRDCPGVFRFDISASEYWVVQMGWQLAADTDPMKVSCTSPGSSSNACAAWTIESSIGAGNRVRVKRWLKSGKKWTEGPAFDSTVAFKVNVALP